MGLLEEVYQSYLEWHEGEYGAPLTLLQFGRRLGFYNVRIYPRGDWENTFYNLHYSVPLKLVS